MTAPHSKESNLMGRARPWKMPNGREDRNGEAWRPSLPACGSTKGRRNMRQLLIQIPPRRSLIGICPNCPTSDPSIPVATSANRGGILISKLHPAARTIIEQWRCPVHSPGRLPKFQTADTTTTALVTEHGSSPGLPGGRARSSGSTPRQILVELEEHFVHRGHVFRFPNRHAGSHDLGRKKDESFLR
jgi:hypothetical protein